MDEIGTTKDPVKSERGRKGAEGRKRKAEARERAARELARTWCGKVHTTWRVQAKCQWPWAQVTGEGPYATYDPRQGPEIRLWASLREAGMNDPGVQTAVLTKGLHKKGRGRTNASANPGN